MAKERQQSEAVLALVECAGFHTYAIELLARSAKYEDDLFSYFHRIRKLGFQFPTLLISSDYNTNSATAAEQLQLLFDMQSRNRKERQILWDFSVLPEGISLSRKEVAELLGYTENDLHCLCQDGWLRYAHGQGFYIHPLIKEIVHFHLKNGNAPCGTVAHLVTLVQENTLISEQDPPSVISRRLYLVENAENYIAFKPNAETANFYYCMGLL